ncbi:hypothetical protein A3A14_04545 [Candidatus Daviesbacteria bacterium RIFCSPLOWO2_01_FULL_43_38]|uniref:Uncharacterized protein n=1 Tax=Candidatus Daviesbacteria bacterium RIFCSPHIGHO2_12_FULL_43_11 TaxID=1797780 RepID=A0A1F5K0S6_9BACT|nr:MAG: hypothetical protein A3E45_04890 [Candidatus Daviesbacteria bacterium RIFCSPHIGHO2_12_FULL_43_11]OGE63801.1 MAG: hypothetical protein A3A14_04545 [Candidatus Daviesbacteria bacterium RIFCSPLOWO2_01_FULL_43_38]OGE69098.1 MAG: hypothetical protein A3J21_00595 [Candidatus Daviesbacteria bacterium RIFCSPLOWO2_02_FULL_43_11]
MIKKVLWVIFVLGLIYILLPGPSKIKDFAPIPDSTKSNLDGDTWQNPNIVAYFSDFKRQDITQFYRMQLEDKYFFGKFIPPIRLNHPPETAYVYIRDQQESTFLEEYIYPFRESLYVNGYEPAVENKMFKKPSNFVGDHVWYEELPYNSKATLRFYPSNPVSRVIIYLSVWAAAIALFRLYRKAL